MRGMRIAARMDIIGTETAFEGAVRARALGATARFMIRLEIGEPDVDTPLNLPEAAKKPNSWANLTEALARIRGIVEPLVAARG